MTIILMTVKYKHIALIHDLCIKLKVGVLRPVQQPGSYWDSSSALPLVESNTQRRQPVIRCQTC